LSESVLCRMRDALAHRGPDDVGLWIDSEAGIGLAHRRLAIVDLSQQGHQPMVSASGRYEIAYNGEIYNHLTLRHSLGETWPWRGHSDTETLLALFDRHGVLATLPLLVGMFALAVWDRQQRRLLLARDRLGEKPLYWGRMRDGSLAFGSELRALSAHPQCPDEIDRDALTLLLRHACIPAPHTIHRGIKKLAPASWLEFDAVGQTGSGRYWQLPSSGGTSTLSDAQAVERLEALLMQSVRDQMLADVPVGAFLSGGVDSSTVVAMMARASQLPVQTFCIGFDNGATNEAQHARIVASHLGTQHHELILGAREALDLVPRLGALYDEPFADSSQIPTFLVAQMARRQVTVALSGDAGDELFAGYNRHGIAAQLWPRLQALPLPLRRGLASLIRALPPHLWDSMGHFLQAIRAPNRRHADLGEKLHKLAAQVLPAADAKALYRALISHWQNPSSLVLNAQEPVTLWQQAIDEADWSRPAEAMMWADQHGYLPDDILVKVDRAAMATSLETRAPLLDHRLVEFAWSIPMHQKRREGQSKWLLRQLLYRHVPRELIERPKQGFAVPLAAWLRGPLRDWAEALLEPQRLREQGFFDVEQVRSAWQAHQSGRQNHQHRLWCVLMFQAWLQERPS